MSTRSKSLTVTPDLVLASLELGVVLVWGDWPHILVAIRSLSGTLPASGTEASWLVALQTVSSIHLPSCPLERTSTRCPSLSTSTAPFVGSSLASATCARPRESGTLRQPRSTARREVRSGATTWQPRGRPFMRGAHARTGIIGRHCMSQVAKNSACASVAYGGNDATTA